MKRVLASILVLALSACGGGGGGSAGTVPQPGSPGGSHAPSPASFADTTGRVGLFQLFDRFMTDAQVQSAAPHYDAVWGAFHPVAWNSGHPGMVVTRYFIPQEDRSELSGHDLGWWQSNHPDWILYACDSSGAPTHDYAFWAGVDRPDIPLDFHNPAVIDYQVRQLNGASAITNGQNALAIDQITFQDAMVGGNPNFGQTVKDGEYACGIWQNGTFVRRYNGVNDPAWTNDVVNFVKEARQIVDTDSTLAPYHLKIVINHPLGSVSNATEQALFENVDAILDERGYADYGRYNTQADANLFRQTTDYFAYAQNHGLAIYSVNHFNATQDLSPAQREYGIAAYYMSNLGREYLYMTPDNGGVEHLYPEYGTKLGTACGSYYGGPALFYRKFDGGLVVLNSGSTTANAALPGNHSYQDIEGRAVTNPLNVAADDAYVLLTSGGCS